MTAQPLTVVYVHNAATVGGGNKVLLGLFEHIDRQRFLPVSCTSRARADGERTRWPRRLFPRGPVGPHARTSIEGCRRQMHAGLCPGVPEGAPCAAPREWGIDLSLRESGMPTEQSVSNLPHSSSRRGSKRRMVATCASPRCVTVSNMMFAEVCAHVSRLSRPPRVVQITNAVDTAAFSPCRNLTAFARKRVLAGFRFL